MAFGASSSRRSAREHSASVSHFGYTDNFRDYCVRKSTIFESESGSIPPASYWRGSVFFLASESIARKSSRDFTIPRRWYNSFPSSRYESGEKLIKMAGFELARIIKLAAVKGCAI